MRAITIIRRAALCLASALLTHCGTDYQRASYDSRPKPTDAVPDAAVRSGASPEGGASSSGVGRTDLPPEQPRR